VVLGLELRASYFHTLPLEPLRQPKSFLLELLFSFCVQWEPLWVVMKLLFRQLNWPTWAEGLCCGKGASYIYIHDERNMSPCVLAFRYMSLHEAIQLSQYGDCVSCCVSKGMWLRDTECEEFWECEVAEWSGDFLGLAISMRVSGGGNHKAGYVWLLNL
jgi:hypothetical protein